MITDRENLTIALSKGRILTESLPFLEAAGIEPQEPPESTRKLILATNRENIRLLIIRAADVPTFVSHGAADMGIAGKDVLLENDVSALYEPIDLGIAKCRLMLACLPDADLDKPRLRIATKYVDTTREWFARQGRQVEVIKLYGSMELAPIVGLADAIVDLVDTGRTLKENGLVTRDHIADISSRLVVNRASMKMKSTMIKQLLNSISSAVSDRAA
ncbi:MAG: ATP phosphoribosyltransferase [Gammaproteobacteria bacterium]|nr:MAG: ATP phosphoribosyltransferase [Gammaproteobacteria bacterium]